MDAETMRLKEFLACLAVLLPAMPSAATPPDPAPLALRSVELVPANTQIGITVYALGMFAQSGHYTHFHGTLQIDQAHPDSCKITMHVEIPSLDMGTESRTSLALGPDMLDPAHYPTMDYAGLCNRPTTTGQLTLHGVTRQLTLSETQSGEHMIATGTLQRRDYGISGRPGLIGGSIAIVFAVDVPPAIAALLVKAR